MQNVRTVRRQQFEDIIYVRNTTQQEESMYTPSAIRVVRIALRMSLAAAFLSAVADRFGWWEPFGQGSWGAWVPSPTMPTSLFRLLLDGY
jgi:hypothetical protein